MIDPAARRRAALSAIERLERGAAIGVDELVGIIGVREAGTLRRRHIRALRCDTPSQRLLAIFALKAIADGRFA